MPSQMGDGMFIGGRFRDKAFQLALNTYKNAARHFPFLPRMVNVETTKVCNLQCPNCRRNFPECIAKEPGPTHLTVEKLWRIVATVPIMVVRFEGDGEPMCNPHFGDLLQFCKRMGMRSAMSTNATLLDEEWVRFLESHGMARIHVSVDGATKDTFEKARKGADFERVMWACGLVAKSKIQLFMNCIMSSDQIVDELPAYVDLARKTGATGVLLNKFQAYDLGFGNPPDWSRHRGVLGNVRREVNKSGLILVSSCTDMPRFIDCKDAYTCPYVLLNDDVYPCTYMANLRPSEVYLNEVIPVPCRNYCMGNLNVNWMREIWRNGIYGELRRTLKETRRPSGHIILPEELMELKRKTAEKGKFSYCEACLCRWGELGL